MDIKYRPSMFGNHIVTPNRLSGISGLISSGNERTWNGTMRPGGAGRFGSGWTEVLGLAGQEYTPNGIGRYSVNLGANELAAYANNRLFIRSHYGGTSDEVAEKQVINHGIASDFKMAQACALKYALDGDEDAAATVATILSVWCGIRFWDMATSNTRLTMSDKWPGFLLAASLISSSQAYTSDLSDKMNETTALWLPQISTAYSTGQSNWAGWGCVFEMSASVFLNDRARFDRAVLLWRKIFDRSVIDDEPWTETGRAGGENLGGDTGGISGIQYSNYFLNSMVRAAEIARVNGVWLYDHEAPDGSTLRGLYENCTAWIRDWTLGPYSGESMPSRNIQSHIIILHNLWPTEDSTNIVEGVPSASGSAVGPGNNFQDDTGHSFTPLLYADLPFND